MCILKQKLLYIAFLLQAFFCFSQQAEEFKNVKNYYNHHRGLLNTEFKKKYDAETNVLNKDAIKRDFLFFMQKMDSIENVALVGALLKTKNLEDLKKINPKTANSEKLPETFPTLDKPANYPGGINALRQEVSNLFYADGVYSEQKLVKTDVAFIVERDGTITNVEAQGENSTFNRQAEIALYSISEKFSPAVFKGGTVRYRYRLPLTMNID